MVTIPDELGTETNKLLHQRLQKKSRERKINIGIEKFDSNKQKKQKKRGVNSIEIFGTQKRGESTEVNLHHPVKELWNCQLIGRVPWLAQP
jgi:hypothetical protein